ncbi:MAG: TIGR04053 family radical SAM/SPASM domain-containing protein [Planctomycetes bacterium]|nr:TIGR04053 family radical SAM/SPASM domain-containing protein [Planctomycetota bacterium]
MIQASHDVQPLAGPSPWTVDFDKAPFLVIWETTQACDLACRHCRACAIPGPIPGELTTDEGRWLIDQVSELGTPLLVLSGGDPATRDDLFELIEHAKERALRVATIPAATPRLTERLIEKLKEAGLDQVAFSLDFPRAELHDGFRGAPGAFARTLEAVNWAHKHGLPPQINTCVWDQSAPYLQEMADLVDKLGAVFWEVFFLVPMGRGTSIGGLTPEGCEELFPILMRAQAKRRFILKVTEAPHYRRFLRQRHEREHGRVEHVGSGESVPMAQRGVNAGNGFLFVSHLGEVYPSGFLPVSAGNVRAAALADLYLESPLFRDLRDPDRLKGRCGRCPFRAICGGSRSRAYALTGDWLETDPWCAYAPPEPAAGFSAPHA